MAGELGVGAGRRWGAGSPKEVADGEELATRRGREREVEDDTRCGRACE
jgi:hypothetical protein